MQPRLTPVAAKIGSGRRPENAFVRSGYGLIGSSEGSHTPRSVGYDARTSVVGAEVRTFVMPPAWRPRPAP